MGGPVDRLLVAGGGRVGVTALCANGDGRPVNPPSKVICRVCLDRIGARLKRWASDGFVSGDETQAPPPKDSDDMDRQAVLDDAGLLEDD